MMPVNIDAILLHLFKRSINTLLICHFENATEKRVLEMFSMRLEIVILVLSRTTFLVLKGSSLAILHKCQYY